MSTLDRLSDGTVFAWLAAEVTDAGILGLRGGAVVARSDIKFEF